MPSKTLNPSIYRHDQTTPATVWTIVHNLGSNGGQGLPIVDAFVDSGGELIKIIPSAVEIINQHTVELTFSSAKEGFAVVIV